MMLSGYPAPCAAAASEARPVVASAVANEPKLSSSAFKNFDEIEDADINPGPAPASKMITLPTLKKPKEDGEDSSRLKRIMAVCAGCGVRWRRLLEDDWN